MSLQPFPMVTADTEAFWQGGIDGVLRRSTTCGCRCSGRSLPTTTGGLREPVPRSTDRRARRGDLGDRPLEGGRKLGRTGRSLTVDAALAAIADAGYLYDACVQLRDQAAGRQVEGAEVAVVGAGGGPLGGCMLLTKDR